ncbi:glucuronyl hydrolase [Segetibacter sp. 3557_3]|uniref:glycoside hydrolase family 88 protein n=1 Tax=Segetibacter sp. 3557_3 TaxID=2547429 RepID=UPI001058B441|nr:glycoside hydrolase family 88 protein [Segetibacter sp. 3557_3]TDH26978.1 glucuronyl hydrolase [Segetibacter sp. 3557_3]
MTRLLIMVLMFVPALALQSQQINMSKVFAEAGQQTEVMLREIPLAKQGNAELVSPRSLDSGMLKLVASRDWTSGFFPGQLWFLYEYTRNNKWKKAAEQYTAYIEREKTNAGTHDMGFKVYCSFGTGYRLTREPRYKQVIIEAATTLATRFNATAGVIKSWDNRTRWKYPVIIDNMMNLELLFAATKLTGNKKFYDIAVSHANTTMKHHFRKDFSSYHVVDYDTTNGAILQKTTHQGYSDESAWSRGQSWGLYGYTMCYRETGNKSFLVQAEKIAAYILNHPNLPADLVPYYDFNAPGIPNEPRDASAASVMASALYELSTFSNNATIYRAAADRIMENLTRDYRSGIGENKGFLLLHSTGSAPAKSEVDVPLSYADYYYLEALLRSRKLKSNKSKAAKAKGSR